MTVEQKNVADMAADMRTATPRPKLFRKKPDAQRTWYYPVDVDNPGDHIYVDDGSHKGHGGSMVYLPLEDGTEEAVRGPWHSNSRALFELAGVDLREQHRTVVVIGTGFDAQRQHVVGVLYCDPPQGQVGAFDRGNKLAQQYANERGEVVAYAVGSMGGSSSALRYPERSN